MAPSAKAESTRVAAEGGCARSQFNLSLYLYSGQEGVAKDDTQSVTWLQKAAAQGHARAEANLGYRLLNGLGVKLDAAAAVASLSKAADKGLAEAQRRLAFCQSEGLGCIQDLPSAVNFSRQAADQGDMTAQRNLAVHYYHGDGVAQDYTEAIKWFSLAAAQGCKVSQYSLGKMYADGTGVKKKDNMTAKTFLTLAAAQGCEKSIALLKEIRRCVYCGTLDVHHMICGRCRLVRYCNAGSGLTHTLHTFLLNLSTFYVWMTRVRFRAEILRSSSG